MNTEQKPSLPVREDNENRQDPKFPIDLKDLSCDSLRESIKSIKRNWNRESVKKRTEYSKLLEESVENIKTIDNRVKFTEDPVILEEYRKLREGYFNLIQNIESIFAQKCLKNLSSSDISVDFNRKMEEIDLKFQKEFNYQMKRFDGQIKLIEDDFAESKGRITRFGMISYLVTVVERLLHDSKKSDTKEEVIELIRNRWMKLKEIQFDMVENLAF